MKENGNKISDIIYGGYVYSRGGYGSGCVHVNEFFCSAANKNSRHVGQ